MSRKKLTNIPHSIFDAEFDDEKASRRPRLVEWNLEEISNFLSKRKVTKPDKAAKFAPSRHP